MPAGLRALLETVRYETDPVLLLRIPDADLLSIDARGGVPLNTIDGSASDSGLFFSDRKAVGRFKGWYETVSAASVESDAAHPADDWTLYDLAGGQDREMP